MRVLFVQSTEYADLKSAKNGQRKDNIKKKSQDGTFTCQTDNKAKCCDKSDKKGMWIDTR